MVNSDLPPVEMVSKLTMCGLLGNVETARLKVDGAVRAMRRAHWNESAGGLLVMKIDMMVQFKTA